MVLIYARCIRNTSSPTDRIVMRKILSFVLFSAAIAGIVWYENQPTTVAIPVEVDEVAMQDETIYYEETTIPEVTETTQPQRAEVSFAEPDVIMLVEGTRGDNVRIQEVIGEPQQLDELAEDVHTAITSCSGVTDRDMVVQVDAKVELTSGLPAEVNVDYGTLGFAALFNYSSGLTCDDGRVNHDMQAGGHSNFTYWVALRNMVTPDHPEGDMSGSWALTNPNVTLPGLETYYWSLWGPRVVTCDSILGDSGKIWLAGTSPADAQRDCAPSTTQDDAMGNK